MRKTVDDDFAKSFFFLPLVFFFQNVFYGR